MTDDARAILITGGSRGIGAATALLAARRGYDVCISFRSQQTLANQVCHEIRACGQRGLAIRADLSNEADIIALWSAAIKEFGSIHALVNNAGILEQQQALVDVELDRLERVFRVNVFGSILLAREAIKHMSTVRGGAGGAIVNLSSVAAILGAPGEYVDYAASKAAIDSMTVGLAKEVAGEGIRVNAVRPGSIYTEIHASGGEPDRVDRVKDRIPMKRGGTPDEIAEAIMWLVSDQSSYAAGTILDVTGGL